MQFQVPQFIEVEDKIIGGIITLKQFIYLAGSGGLAFIIFKYSPSIYISGIPVIAVLGFGVALAFYRLNGRAFIEVIESGFKYYTGSKLFIWKKRDTSQPLASVLPKDGLTDSSPLYVPRLSDSKLKDLTWSLDIKESLNPVTRDNSQ